jgi:hypothetical protein
MAKATNDPQPERHRDGGRVRQSVFVALAVLLALLRAISRQAANPSMSPRARTAVPPSAQRWARLSKPNAPAESTDTLALRRFRSRRSAAGDGQTLPVHTARTEKPGALVDHPPDHERALSDLLPLTLRASAGAFALLIDRSNPSSAPWRLSGRCSRSRSHILRRRAC